MTGIKKYLLEHIIGTQYEYESHFESIIYILKKKIAAYKPGNLLDVGCNRGERTARLAHFFNMEMSQCYGVDWNKEQVEECKKIFKAEVIDLESMRLPYEDNMFDFVVCNQVLEHIKNYKDVLNDIIRVTRTGGYIIIGVPNLAHIINRFYLLFGFQPMCIYADSNHIRVYTHTAFVTMLRSFPSVTLVGFTGTTMYPMPFFIAKYMARVFVGLSGYTCYLLQKK